MLHKAELIIPNRSQLQMLSVKCRKTGLLNQHWYVMSCWCYFVGNESEVVCCWRTRLSLYRSTLPFPGSQELYEVRSDRCSGRLLCLHLQQPSHCRSVSDLYDPQVFIRDLVWNLFGEGNDVFREGDWTKSMEMYTEALSVAEYADSEEIYVPESLLEKLYANRAAAYLNIVPVSRRRRRFLSVCQSVCPSVMLYRVCSSSSGFPSLWLNISSSHLHQASGPCVSRSGAS